MGIVIIGCGCCVYSGIRFGSHVRVGLGPLNSTKLWQCFGRSGKIFRLKKKKIVLQITEAIDALNLVHEF